MTGQVTQIERQWIILRTLAARRFGVTVQEFARDFGTHDKTIRRDLDTLRGLGFPITQREGEYNRNHWLLAVDSNMAAMCLDYSELLSLYVSRTLLEPLMGTVVWESAQSAFRKIKATLDEQKLQYLDELVGSIRRTTFGDSDYRDRSDLIDNLMVAIEGRRVTTITYQSARATEPTTYDVHPYGLVYHRGTAYLVAHSPEHGEVRNFKLDRMTDAVSEANTFPYQSDAGQEFDLAAYLHNSLGVYQSDQPPVDVVIRFAADAARYVSEHKWHHSQHLEPQPDGRLLVKLQLSALEEVKAWILSFGHKAEALEPPELREMIATDLAGMQAIYQDEFTQQSPETERHQ